MHKILWDCEMQMNHRIVAVKSNQVLIDKRKELLIL